MTLAVLCSLGWKLEDAKRHIPRCRPCVGFPDVYTLSVQRYLRECHGGGIWGNK